LKLHELTKKFGLNFLDFKKHLISAGFTQYQSPNKKILDQDLDQLTELAEKFTETQVKLSAEKLEKRKGKFIGIVYDRKNVQFKSVVIKASYRQLVESGIDFEVLEEHSTIYSAMIKVSKSTAKTINANTIKKYGKTGE
jgi:hypothetical protein